jgi:hypothetical protein
MFSTLMGDPQVLPMWAKIVAWPILVVMFAVARPRQ